MSSLIDLAVTRGEGEPEKRRRYRKKNAPDEAAAEAPAGLGTLVSAIPVELITLYTTFVAATITRATPSAAFLERFKKEHGTAYAYDQTRDLIGLRWLVYGALCLTVVGIVYQGWAKRRNRVQDKRNAPVTEAAAGLIAFATWGLVMPGGLLAAYVESRDLAVVTLGIITIVAAGMLALGWGVLKNKASNTTWIDWRAAITCSGLGRPVPRGLPNQQGKRIMNVGSA